MVKLLFLAWLSPMIAAAQPVIYANQVGYDIAGPKMAVVRTDAPLGIKSVFTLVDASGREVYVAPFSKGEAINEWADGKLFYRADFTAFRQPGEYKLAVVIGETKYESYSFSIRPEALVQLTLPSVLHYYRRQRANTPREREADKAVILFGSTNTANVQGGWCDASGDISKYFSHLAYTNVMSPQQIPLVTWSLANTREAIPKLLSSLQVMDSITAEALWGADYIMRSLSAEDYFYMTVFSYFKPDPKARRIVGLLANSVTTSDYQCAFREGGGMAIAALARIARWKKDGAYTSSQYLAAAKRAFAHLLINNTRYDDDGKENMLDDYCALMAATELWNTTNEILYRDEARKRAANITKRMSDAGFFMANDSGRPFWHASDAGMPVVALSRYLTIEKDATLRSNAIATIRRALEYNLRVTADVNNPFGYARQSFLYQGKITEGFFIPHENESGWWWQGENARLSSLATAALVGGKIAFPGPGGKKTRDSLTAYANHQLAWILGCNPYSMCFMYGFGKQNVPYMASLFGHGSEKGGISNGITGKDGQSNGSGIDFKTSAEGNEWRWTEQWLPHAAWYLQAVTAMAEL
jgi:Glycosyl hydrolase family 9/Cellulase N-terminal ig-like domain